MSLDTKYRPGTLDEVVGNTSTVKALKTILERDRADIQHSFLFTGPSGCGKTTLARIVAKELGAVNQNYAEIDSADFRGIDSIREIRRNMMFKAINGPCRVWLLDECHQLSKDGQNALLKALEDTPPHVFFLLATTDPEKLLKTIKTRCATFTVEALEEDEMMPLLRTVARNERKRVHPDILRQISRDSMGSCRDALQILDKIIDLPADEMKAAAEQTAASQNAVIDLCRALIRREPWKEVLKIISGLSHEEPERVRRAILSYSQKVQASGKHAAEASVLISEFEDAPVFTGGWATLQNRAYIALLSD